ncbi:glycosyltransferase [Ferrovibrio sp.]|uniref:glycosyltransferase family 4 protein n=1 Tax=Ferrovibrio sp. TaxID=1917215 RepID=UPI001B46CE41|nr:glycosyltransferase [Ferrovibrio sp.]MBP7064860.1 glycosyltransferase [Ferrovibrio sp.]
MRLTVAGPVNLAQLRLWLDAAPAERAAISLSGIAGQVAALLAAGQAVELVTWQMAATESWHVDAGALRLHVAPFRQRHRMRDLMRQEREAITRLVQASRPDIVHAHWCYEFALGALAAHDPARVVVTAHDWAGNVLRHTPDAYRLGRWWLFQRTLRQAQHFLAVSPPIEQWLRQAGRRVHGSIPLGIDAALIQPSARRYPSGPPLLLAVNNGFGKLKNVATLLRAFVGIRRQNPAARLLLLGQNFEPDGPAAAWARQRQLEAGVGFIGPVDAAAVLRHMDAATLLVHPSLEETQPQVAVEAMARGLPVLAGWNAHGPEWILDQGRAGILVDTRKADEVSAGILAVIEDTARWEALSQAGLQRARDVFTADRVAQQHLAVYQRLAGNAGMRSV